jgi:hypothetical protein
MNITLQPAQVVTLPDPIIIGAVRDQFIQKRIIAKIKGLPMSVVLWDGPDEYAAAGNWTNESVLARATEVLALSSIPWTS